MMSFWTLSRVRRKPNAPHWVRKERSEIRDKSFASFMSVLEQNPLKCTTSSYVNQHRAELTDVTGLTVVERPDCPIGIEVV
jgi:hypothetical protein